MPRALWQANDDLAVEVHDFKARYTPGDVIEGHVTRRNRSDYRTCSVRLIFFGRVKTSFGSGQDSNGRRANVVLFESIYGLHNSVNSGQVSTNPDHSWPFRITIPSHPVPRDYGRPDRSDRLPPEKGYLSNEGDISSHSLPGTFACPDKYSCDQFVEYVLKAELRFQGEGDRPIEGTLPLNIQPPGTVLPIPSFKPKVFRQILQPIRSPKCLPENAAQDLSFADKLRSKVSSRTPYYAFQITVIAPTIIQLKHPEVFPLKIYVTPRFGKGFSTFGEGEPYNMPPTMFKSLKLKLVGRARYRGLSTWSDTGQENAFEHKFTLPEEQEQAVVPILMPELPPSFEAATGRNPDPGLPAWSTLRKSQEVPSVDETKALDLGEVFLLKPHRVRPSNPPPTFKSYNLALQYFLEYKIDLRTVDVDHRAEGLVPVALLAPCEEFEAEMRVYRAQQSVRHDDIKEWTQMTGARAHSRDAPLLLSRLFGCTMEDEKTV